MSHDIILAVVMIFLLSILCYSIERCRFSSKEIALISVLAALAALGRVVFTAIPSVQPTTFFVITSGAVFGSTIGLAVGMVAAVVSNIFLGQGPWTFFQMLAWALCGVSAGMLLRIYPQANRKTFILFGFMWGYLFGWFMNLWYWYSYVYPLTFKTWIATNVASFWFDTAHAVANMLFFVILGGDFLVILKRFKGKLSYSYAPAIFAALLMLPGSARATDLLISAGYERITMQQNVSGGFDFLLNGDVLAIKSSSGNPALYIFDANGDGVPSQPELVSELDSGSYGSFVNVSPDGTFALFGVTGTTDTIWKIDLSTRNISLVTSLQGNFSLDFLDNEKVLVSVLSSFNTSVVYFNLNSPGAVTPVVLIPDSPTGPVVLNERGDLYYVRSTWDFPAPPASHRLMKFDTAAISQAIATGVPLEEDSATMNLSLNSGYGLAINTFQPEARDIYISTFEGFVLRVHEESFQVENFITPSDSFSSVTHLNFFHPEDKFLGNVSSQTKLGASFATNFFSENLFFEIRPQVSVPDDEEENTPVVNEFGVCVPEGSGDCLFQKLSSSACVGANGFLGQLNVVSVLNLQTKPLSVSVEYFDSMGIRQGAQNAKIGANLKRDFIINDLGLRTNTVGSVCVKTDGEEGSWSGGITLYKPDTRDGVSTFGKKFDFALSYPFLNPQRGQTAVSVNTFHLGTNPLAVVANWISIVDAERDGKKLTGKIIYFDEKGNIINRQNVSIPDGGRKDFSAHDGLTGGQNMNALGLAQFVPSKKTQSYHLTLTRYFYDCAQSVCNNFLAAFNLPYRPGLRGLSSGGISTTSGELSVVELLNPQSTPSSARVEIYNESGTRKGNQRVQVSAMGTRHLIVNRVGETGFLSPESVGVSTVKVESGFMSALSLFYKLDSTGKLLYAYAAPFMGAPDVVQISQFNSFIKHRNVPEIYNPSNTTINIDLDFLDFTGKNVFSKKVLLSPHESHRFSDLVIPENTIGTVILQADREGALMRNYIVRTGEYVMTFPGQ